MARPPSQGYFCTCRNAAPMAAPDTVQHMSGSDTCPAAFGATVCGRRCVYPRGSGIPAVRPVFDLLPDVAPGSRRRPPLIEKVTYSYLISSKNPVLCGNGPLGERKASSARGEAAFPMAPLVGKGLSRKTRAGQSNAPTARHHGRPQSFHKSQPGLQLSASPSKQRGVPCLPIIDFPTKWT